MAILLIVVVEMETDTESVANGILDAMVERLSVLGWLENRTPVWRREKHLKATLSFICEEADDEEVVAQKASCRLATGWTILRQPSWERSVHIWDSREPGESLHPATRFICVEASASWLFADPSRPSQPRSVRRKAK